ncbi:MAG TPA: zinc-ribbon and DUF3426 domain-containing protein [Candidimonas sp.]|nr:zinc-ribbon and DUF3426 domain-containing protein [Candidimonas sp.]
MDLTTRCPRCGTLFSANLEQLQLRKGYIRCVECANIFDGYEAVVPGSDDAAAASAALVQAAAPVSMPAAVAAAPIASAPAMPSVVRQRPVKEDPVPAVRMVPESGKPTQAGGGTEFRISTPRGDTVRDTRQDPVFRGNPSAPIRPDPIISITPASASRQDDTVSAPVEPRIGGQQGVHQASSRHAPGQSIYIEPRSPTDDDAPIPEFLGRDTRFRSVAKLFWGVLTVAGLVLLLAQSVYVYRAQIANQIPALRPALTQACLSLHCKVAYERRIDQISIMTSSLRAAPGEAGASGSMTLQLTLRNTYDKPQEWPTLVLDLTDFSGTVVVRKNLAPANYLPSEMLQQPFAASSEVTVGVPIVLNDLKINGYQLGKFFP